MNVHILIYVHDYDTSALVGVFSTKEKAELCKEQTLFDDQHVQEENFYIIESELDKWNEHWDNL